MDTNDERNVLRLRHLPFSSELIPLERCIFLKGYEPMANSNATVEFTENLEDAKTFASTDEMQEYVRQIDPENPMRSDGRPNRPVSKYAMHYCSADYFVRTTTGWAVREEHLKTIMETDTSANDTDANGFLGRLLLEHEIQKLAEIAPEQHIIVLFHPLGQTIDPARSFVTRARKLAAFFDAYYRGMTVDSTITMTDGREFDLRKIKAMVAIPNEAGKSE